MIKLKKPTRSETERGVLIPILAVVGGAAFFFILVLVIWLFRNYKSAEAITTINDDICLAMVTNLPQSQQDSVIYFKDSLNDRLEKLDISYLKITKVDFGLASMPADGTFGYHVGADSNADGGVDACDDNAVGFIPTNPGANDFSSLIGAGCNIDGGDCQYHWDICEDDFFKDNFPKSAATNLQDVGVSAFCRIEAEVDILVGTRTVVAKSVHTIKLQGKQPVYDANNPSVTSQALTLIIDPHLNAHAPWGPNSGYDHHIFSTAYPNGIDQRFSPFKIWTGPPAQLPQKKYLYAANAQSHAYTTTGPAWWTPALNAGVAAWMAAGPFIFDFPPCNGINSTFIAATNFIPAAAAFYAPLDRGSAGFCTGAGFTPQSDLLTTMMSPPILVRNVVSATLMELAMRTPLRENSELLVVNRHHRYQGAAGGISDELNFPVTVMNLGEDGVEKRFQIPALFHHGGIGGVPNMAAAPLVPPLGWDPNSPGPWLGTGLAGMIFPFGPTVNGAVVTPVPAPFAYPQTANSTAPPFAPSPISDYHMRTMHAWQSFSLRYGYTAYWGYQVGNIVNSGIDRWSDFGFDNSKFEPSNYAPRNFWNGPYMPGTQHLDQQLPYGGGVPVGVECKPGLMGPTDCMSVVEVAASLGAARDCPWIAYPMYDPTAVAPTYHVANSNFVTCADTNFADTAYGDIRAALAATLAGGERIARPGVFLPALQNIVPNPLNIQPAVQISDPAHPFGPDKYQPWPGVDSTVVLVLSQLSPDATGEPAAISALVQQLNDAGRPVKVFYVPYNDNTADPNEVLRVQTTFRHSTGDVPTINQVFVFSPYDADNVDGSGNALYGTAWDGNMATNFTNYWANILDNNSEDFLPLAVERIAVRGIWQSELKL